MRSRHVQALAAITAVAALVRFSTLDLQSFWLDEAFTVDLLRRDLWSMLRELPEHEATPPLYYLLAWLWSQPFGLGEVGLRSLSALIGTATVPVAYAAAAALVSRRAGLIAAALVAVSPLLVWYSQEARSYELLALMGGLSFLYFARALEQPGRRSLAREESDSRPLAPEEPGRRSLVLWAVWSGLALLTHYYAAFLVVPEALWLVIASRRARPVLYAAAAVLAVGAALIPLALAQEDNVGRIRGQSLVERALQVPKQFLVGFDLAAEVALAILACVLALAGVALVLLRGSERERRGAVTAGALGGIAVAVPALLAVAGIDYLLGRNLIFAAIPLTVAISAGFGAARAGAVGPACAAGLCAICAVALVSVWTRPEFQRDDWRAAAEALGDPAPGGRAVVVTPGAGVVPLRAVYLRGARELRPSESATVTGVEALGLAADQPGVTSGEDEPGAAPPTPPAFTPAGQETGEGFALFRFRAPQPVPVTPEQIQGSRVDRTLPSGAILVEPGSP